MVEEDGDQGDICIIALTVLVGIVSVTRSLVYSYFSYEHCYLISMQRILQHA